MVEVVFAFSGAERGDQFADPAAEMWDGSLGGLAEKRLQFAKRPLDRIEVWRIFRQVKQRSAGSFDGLLHSDPLVGREVVDDDDLAVPERWRQILFEIGKEGGSLVIGPSTTKGAVSLSWRSPATKVFVFQCPCSTRLINRSPRRQRPRSRTMLLKVEVSSMNTSRVGSNMLCSRIQRRRACATSGRSCFAARRLFFKLTPWRGNNRQTVLRLPTIRRLCIATRTSSSVKSGCAPIRASSQPACFSSGERLPPVGLAATLPVLCQRCIHLTAELGVHLKPFGRLTSRRTRFDRVQHTLALQKSNRYRQTRSSKDPRESPDSTQPRYALGNTVASNAGRAGRISRGLAKGAVAIVRQE
jgi:hypothetical protein